MVMRAAWLILSVIVLVACGGGGSGGSGGPQNPPPSNTIGPAGGTVTGPNGSRVVIPAGALSQATAIAITASNASAPPVPAGFPAVSQIFALTPHGTVFAAPVTITLPFDPTAMPTNASPAVRKTNAAQTGWEPAATQSISGSEIAVQVSSFSWAYVSFTPPPQLTVQLSGSGTVIGSGIKCPADCTESYALSTVVTLEAVPASGWRFAGWVAGCDSVVGNQCSVTMTGSRTVPAIFESLSISQSMLTVAAHAGPGYGLITGTGIKCGETCEQIYPGGTSLTLTATPFRGSEFLGWGGCDLIVADQCTVMMNDPLRNVTASFGFLPNTAQLGYGTSGPGAEAAHFVSDPPGLDCRPWPCGVRFPLGETVRLIVTDGSPPVQSWVGCDSFSGNSCTVVMRNDPTGGSAIFNSPNVAGVTVHMPRAGAGTVHGIDGEIACEPDCHHSYPFGTTVTLIAEPAPNSQFSGWSACDRVINTTRCEIDVRIPVHDIYAFFD